MLNNQGGHTRLSHHEETTIPRDPDHTVPRPSLSTPRIGPLLWAHLKLLALDSRIACRSAFSNAALEGLSGSGGGIAPPAPPPPPPPAPSPLIRSGLDCNLARAGDDLSTDAGRAGRGGGGNRLLGSTEGGER